MSAHVIDHPALQDQIERWNGRMSPGASVRVKGYATPKRTRTPAMILFSQKAVVYLEGHNGYFDLADVAGEADAVPAPPVRTATLAGMFPGQGSQKVGMGAALFEAFPQLTAAADAILGYSLKDLCLSDPQGVLDQTQYTQPALYAVDALSYLHETRDGAPTPGFLLGHSLGEYAALFAAGVFDFETGLRLVQKRGALMAEAKGGGMAAVVGMDRDRVHEILSSNGLDAIDLANLNSPAQVVISGPREVVVRAQAVFEGAGARMYIPLKVSGAFHSRYMVEAKAEFASFLSTFQFQPPTVPVISNVEAKPYEPARTAALLADQLTSPVRWTESVQYLVSQGVGTFREMGPGAVLAGLVGRIRKPG